MNQESKNLWMAVIFAVIAAGLLYSHIQEKNKEVTKKYGAKTTVVIAKVGIREMAPINETQIELREMPVEFVSPGSVQDPNEIIGMVALVSFKPGEQLLKNKITKPSPLTGLSLQVSPGKRAITIPVDEMRAVAKLLKPGDRIDILAAVSVGSGQNRKKEVKPIMQSVPILATGVQIANELPVLYERNKKGDAVIIKNLTRNTNFNSITIEASPNEAQKVFFILNQNPKDLMMVLRHPTDTGPVSVGSTTAESIMGRRFPAAKKKKRAGAAGTRGFR
ncbi:MAG: Flp pilus assembly protein CpaB [Bdellovibrionales bacterium]